MNPSADDLGSLPDLISSESQAEFVRKIVAWKQNQSKRMSLSVLARQCGFSSKSFIREVIIGKKKMSPTSASKFASGLKLPDVLGEYLLSLVERDSAKGDSAVARAEKEIGKIRHRALSSSTFGAPPTPDAEEFAQNWRLVYAALGSENVGATLAQIQKRTLLPRDEIKNVLELLFKYGLVRYDKKLSTYHAKDTHLILTSLPSDHQSFPRFFASSLAKLKSAAETDFNSKSNLLFASAIQISEKNLPAIRVQIHNTLLKLVDELEDGSGDRVKTLLLGFH